jgi:hypothetical protein
MRGHGHRNRRRRAGRPARSHPARPGTRGGTGRWLAWSRSWAHKIVLERRKEIASRLLDFDREGTLTIVETPGADVTAVADIVCDIEADGLLAEKQAIAVDSVGIVDIVDELTSEERGITLERIVGISQVVRRDLPPRKAVGVIHCIRSVRRRLGRAEDRYSRRRYRARVRVRRDLGGRSHR